MRYLDVDIELKTEELPEVEREVGVETEAEVRIEMVLKTGVKMEAELDLNAKRRSWGRNLDFDACYLSRAGEAQPLSFIFFHKDAARSLSLLPYCFPKSARLHYANSLRLLHACESPLHPISTDLWPVTVRVGLVSHSAAHSAAIMAVKLAALLSPLAVDADNVVK